MENEDQGQLFAPQMYSPKSLSKEQFANIASDMASGGFSAKVAGPGATGQGPAGDAYMVGGYKGLFKDFPSTPTMTGSDLRDFSARPEMYEALKEPNIYLGGWPASNPPRQSLDVSEAITPTTSSDPDYEARIKAAERNQEGIGVIKGGEYAGDIGYPYYAPGAPQTGRDADLFDAAWASGGEEDPAWKKIK